MQEELRQYFLWCVHEAKDLNQVVELTPEEILENAKKLAKERPAPQGYDWEGVTQRLVDEMEPDDQEEQALLEEIFSAAIDKACEADSHSVSGQVAQLCSVVTEQKAKVLRLRHGLEDGCPRSLDEVGREFNVTRERIRQIHVKALHDLRRHLREQWRRTHLV